MRHSVGHVPEIFVGPRASDFVWWWGPAEKWVRSGLNPKPDGFTDASHGGLTHATWIWLDNLTARPASAICPLPPCHFTASAAPSDITSPGPRTAPPSPALF
uniref:Uncharacterized protein n=1 Tax=Physcomitrium patens TaxID=3218 RepID=A0A2K1JUP2_PHYPA|nr:hypothetical protein PHYPA_015014 [Physcomitrium patens]